MIHTTQEQIISIFDYRDGNLYWKVSNSNRVKIGALAGGVYGDGYRHVKIDGKLYYAHRLVFLYHYGHLPKFLDHIDGNRSNNDIFNLREATNRENQMNRKKNKSMNGKPTSSEYKGVCWDEHREKWLARITIDGKQKYLGLFASEIAAALAYNKSAIEAFGEYIHLNNIGTIK